MRHRLLTLGPDNEPLWLRLYVQSLWRPLGRHARGGRGHASRAGSTYGARMHGEASDEPKRRGAFSRREETRIRRTDKEISERALISQIIDHAQVCRLGLAMDNTPYVLPVSFGYDGKAIYFHTAKEGRKIVFLAANNRVCFEFEQGVQVVRHDSSPCKWTFSFQSVIGYGTVLELTSATEKIDGLNHIMKHYSGRDWPISTKDTDAIRVWKIAIESLTGKQSQDKFDTRWMA